MSEEKAIYEFHWDCGRMGDLGCTFVAKKSDVENLIGKEIYFGEVLGKHSEIYGKLEESDLTVLTDDQEFIAQFEKILGEEFSSGYNPLHHYEEEDWEDD